MADPVSPINMPIWNGFGLIAQNGVITLPIATLDAMLSLARQEGQKSQ